MSERTSRRRVLAGLGAGITVVLAGCSSGGGGSTTEDTGGTTEDTGGTTEDTGGTTEGGADQTTTEDTGGSTTEDTGGTTTAEGGKSLTLNLTGSSSYQSEVVAVESLTFVAASEDADSPTLEVGETADISKGDFQNPVTIADDLEVPYGTYESVEMTITPKEVIDGDGNSVDVSGGTVSRTFTELDDEPNTIEESRFDATLTLGLAINNGQYEVSGYKSTGLG